MNRAAAIAMVLTVMACTGSKAASTEPAAPPPEVKAAVNVESKVPGGTGDVARTPEPAAGEVRRGNAPLVITVTQVGPLTQATQASVSTLAALLPGEWQENEALISWLGSRGVRTEGLDVQDRDRGTVRVLDHPEVMKVIPRDDGTIAVVEIFSEQYATSRGSKIGDAVTQLAATYPDLECTGRQDSGISAECWSPSSAGIVFRVEGPKVPIGRVAPSKLTGHSVSWIRWSAPAS